MRVLVTGPDGFLGWHTRIRLRALTDHEVLPVSVRSWDRLPDLVGSADAVLHFAGVNRASDREVEHGNAQLARDVAAAVARSARAPTVIYANTIHAGNGTPYGTGKAEAASILREATAAKGAAFVDVMLPNLFGEHGRPNYNSFVATFVHKVVSGTHPDVQDREVPLLHVQEAAQTFLEALVHTADVVRPEATSITAAKVLDILSEQFAVYRLGEIPALPSRLHMNLFNTLRAAMFPSHYPIKLARHTDNRGSLVETVRAHGSAGQAFVSTTAPGATRGQHYHLRKVERFVVVRGQACIRVRRMLTDPVVTFDVSGDCPVIIDMPTLWAHSITNTGTDELTTMFWTNELFEPGDSDTYSEVVQ